MLAATKRDNTEEGRDWLTDLFSEESPDFTGLVPEALQRHLQLDAALLPVHGFAGVHAVHVRQILVVVLVVDVVVVQVAVVEAAQTLGASPAAAEPERLHKTPDMAKIEGNGLNWADMLMREDANEFQELLVMGAPSVCIITSPLLVGPSEAPDSPSISP